MAKNSVCAIDGCLKPSPKKGYCNAHYLRLYRHGTIELQPRPVSPSTIYLKNVVIPYAGDDCLNWPFTRDAMGRAIRRNKNDNTRLVHRYVCEAVHGAPPTPKHEAAHSCGKGHEGCVNPNHLRWATPKENAADKVAHGTDPRGERHPFAVLSWEKVKEIRELKGIFSQRTLAKKYGVNQQCISLVQNHRTWKEYS